MDTRIAGWKIHSRQRRNSQLGKSRVEGARNGTGAWSGRCAQRTGLYAEGHCRILADQEARKVGPESLRKSEALLVRGFGPWCKRRKLHLLKQVGPAELKEFRNSWNNSAATTLRKHERVRSFFAFCVSNNWLIKNPMEALKKPVVHRGKPTDYFTREEFSKILEATYKYEYGGGNDCRFRKDRLRALVLLMRWSGLSIKDAVT